MEGKKDSGTYPYILALIAFLPPLVTYFHHSIWNDASARLVLEELYYLPLFLGAFTFSRRGAFLTYLYVSACYLPFFFGTWVPTSMSFLDRFLHLAFSGCFTILVSFFTRRQKKSDKEEEQERYLAGMGRAAATIVHDLKNYLITLLIYARLIREGKKSPDEGLSAIIDSAQRMQKIADEVMDFAKPLALDVKEEEALQVLEAAYSSCQAKASDEGIGLHLELPPASLRLTLDSLQVQRALVNLVYNAIEASSRGQKVFVSLRSSRDAVRIGVRDFGSGMDPETARNIFLPFFSRKSKGTGLGMVIVKKVVDAHRGQIKILSKFQQGTEVVIELLLGNIFPPPEKLRV